MTILGPTSNRLVPVANGVVALDTASIVFVRQTICTIRRGSNHVQNCITNFAVGSGNETRFDQASKKICRTSLIRHTSSRNVLS